MFDNLPEATTLFQTLNLIVTIPSIMGSLLMSFHCFKARSTNFTMNMILAIGLSDLMFSFSNLLPLFDESSTSTSCNVEGVMRVFSASQSMFWAFSIAVLHYKIIYEGQEFNKWRFFKGGLVVGPLLSLMIGLR